MINALTRGLARVFAGSLGMTALGVGAFVVTATPAAAQQQIIITGQVQPGLWVDPDGCLHWVADGGIEGYMEGRVNPENGMPVCLDVNPCGVANTDTMFQSGSARLTGSGRQYLQQFFAGAGAYAYAIYGHTDSRASDEYNMRLSERRAAAVANVARSVGARVAREIGYGERRPVAPNDSAANMQRNRRVEIVCYR
ncbi:OmpA family protein [Jannaschia sp. CCS1]|uniref:OmpA family protein n=1 Tax=Jannaschia sp. (strain CCS1) TaxID=290400 RepID=UPI000053ABF0|nr:OmpA family protein [Jannaschia sp. CCS1]ABD53615.1 OmpA/MotB [Jannaschia sp. CCS1]